jgi:multiple sugar transport system ATP-binding protein
MARVLLDNVTKVFDGNVVAISNMILDIADQEFMVIVGPSGCGKTTTLRMIAGLDDITKGTITIGDTVVNNIPPKDRDVAMVFQNYALYPHMTAFQNMGFGLKLRKYSKAEIKKRVEDAAKMLGIETVLHRKPTNLSGGQRQRVALGRAIVRNPKAFLFDEPLSNLDVMLRVTTRAELKALCHKLRTTTIYVTHDQTEAMTLGDRICVMLNGIIQQVAAPMEVYDKPVNKFVADFIGNPPMNFFEGRIEFDKRNPKFIMKGDSEIALPKKLMNCLSVYKNSKMILGIRPEYISFEPIDGQRQNEISATVDIVQPMGDKTEVYLMSRSNQKFVTSINSHSEIKVNETVKTYVDINHVTIFEPGITGRNVCMM